jgi:hypothetical protein
LEWLTISSSASRRLTGTGTGDPPLILWHGSNELVGLAAD